MVNNRQIIAALHDLGQCLEQDGIRDMHNFDWCSDVGTLTFHVARPLSPTSTAYLKDKSYKIEFEDN